MAGYFFDPTAAQRQAVSEFGNYLSESRRQDALKAQQAQQNQLIEMQLMEHAQKLAQAQQEQQNTQMFSQMAQQPVPMTRQVANPDFSALEQRITQAQNAGALDTSGTRMAYPMGSAENKLVQQGVQMPTPSDAAIEQIMQQYGASSPSSMMAQPLDERTIASAVLQQAQQAAMKHPSAYGREMVKQMSDEFYKRYPAPLQTGEAFGQQYIVSPSGMPVFPPKQANAQVFDLGDKLRVQPASGDAYELPKAAKPDTMIKIESQRDKEQSGGKSLPASLIKEEAGAKSEISRANSVIGNINVTKSNIESGALPLNISDIAKYKMENLTGNPSENALKFSKLIQTIKNSTNSLISQQKGPQTDGDAKRLAAEVDGMGLDITKYNKKNALRILNEISRIQGEIIKERETYINTIRSESGKEPVSTSPTSQTTSLSERVAAERARRGGK